jgi:hypothetical protein
LLIRRRGALKVGRKRGKLASDLAVRNAQITSRLQIEPELCAGLKPVSEAKGWVAGDGAFALNDLRNAIRRHSNLPRQFGRRDLHLGRRDLKLVQLVGKDFAGVNCGAGHGSTSTRGIQVGDLRQTYK